MILENQVFNDCINSPVRRIKGRVELYEGSTLIETFNSTDKLKSFTIERTGEETKFFGYGICQKLTVKLIDRERSINVSPTSTLEAVMGTQCYYTYTNPLFYITEMSRDEITNELTLVAYDKLYDAATIKVADLDITPPYTLEVFAAACAAALGLPLNRTHLPDGFDVSYPLGGNLEGTETLRDVLDALAEATQTIYFIDHNWELTFKRLDRNGNPVLTIDKSKYFTLKSSVPCILTQVCHVTELGDNLIAGVEGGYTQYIRDNPFWNNREDVAELLEQAAVNVVGLSVNQFSCTWRGNYLLEIGDKISLITKDNETIYAYLLNDAISYNGALSEKSQWTFSDTEAETPSNPATLGDALKYTYAKVDKVNKRIELVVSESTDLKNALAQITVEADSIRNSVEETNRRIDEHDGAITEISKKVETQITPEQMTIAIKTEIANGVESVVTSTGYTFDDEGLRVSKSSSEMTTLISDDGMTVSRRGEQVLIANNQGVKAENLHATNYLIIDNNSRFEDYNGNRTACFWVGG